MADGHNIARAGRILGELISHKLTLIPALSAVAEVKVETTVTNTATSGE